MVIDFVGGFYEDRNRGFDYQRCINWYPALTDSGNAKSRAQLIGCPGKRNARAITVNTGTGCRGLYETASGRMFGAWGDSLKEIGSNEIDIDRNSSLRFGNLTGNVSMADNGNQLMIVENGAGYIYDLSANTIQKITDSDYPTDANLVVWKDGYFIVSVPGTKKFYLSARDDGLTWSALRFASIVSQPDEITGLIASSTDLWLFGKKSYEAWDFTGNSLFPYERIQNANFEIGCKSPQSIQKINNIIYWLGSNKNGFGQIWRSRGYGAEKISTHAVEKVLKTAGDTVEAISYTYQDEGHTFYIITIDSIGKTFAFDTSTGQWHERAYWNSAAAEFQRDKADYHVFAFGKNYIAYTGDNNLYELSLDVYTDNSDEIRRLRTSPHIHSENKKIKINRIELEFERGVGNANDPDENPQIGLRISKDGGYTYGNMQFRSMGKIGEYGIKAEWHLNGIGKDNVFELSTSTTTRANIIGMYADLEVLKS